MTEQDEAQYESRFEGGYEHPDLKGFVFDCSVNLHADQYTKTVKEISEYVGMRFNSEVKEAIDTLVVEEHPLPKGTDTECPLFKEEVRQIIAEKRALEKQLRKVYPIIWGQVSDTMKARVEAESRYKEVLERNDAIELLKIIRQISFDMSAPDVFSDASFPEASSPKGAASEASSHESAPKEDHISCFYYVGQKVQYVDSQNQMSIVEIVEIHLEDSLIPFYTIKMPDGREKQTDHTFLSQCENAVPSETSASETFVSESSAPETSAPRICPLKASSSESCAPEVPPEELDVSLEGPDIPLEEPAIPLEEPDIWVPQEEPCEASKAVSSEKDLCTIVSPEDTAGMPPTITMDRGTETETLESVEKMAICQTRRGWCQELLGCEAKNEFKYYTHSSTPDDLSNDGKELKQVYESIEETDCFCRMCCTRIHPFKTQIKRFDPEVKESEEILTIIRPCACEISACKCCCYQMADFTSLGEKIGSIKETCFYCIPTFNVYESEGQDGSGTTLLYVVRPPTCCGGCCINCCAEGNPCGRGCCNVSFRLYKPGAPTNGKAKYEGKISSKPKRLAKDALFTDADLFYVKFPSEATSTAKRILIGTTIFLNSIFFE